MITSVAERFTAFRRWLFGTPFRAWPQLLAWRMTGRELVRTGRCQSCGECCRQINLKLRGDWLKRADQFEEITAADPGYRRFYITGRDSQGYLLFECQLLGLDGRCLDYQNRLDLCRAFPTDSLILCGGKPPPSCGYTIAPAIPFNRRLQRALKRHEP